MNANFTAAAPSATAFSVQRPVCTEAIGKAVLLSRWSCGFCWFRKHSGFFWEKHNGNDAYYFNYTHIYILFKIKILVTRGSLLMVPCIFLQQLLRDSPTCVTEPGTGSFWSTLPSFSNHLQSSSLTRPVTPHFHTTLNSAEVSFAGSAEEWKDHRWSAMKFQKSPVTRLSPEVKSCKQGR